MGKYLFYLRKDNSIMLKKLNYCDYRVSLLRDNYVNDEYYRGTYFVSPRFIINHHFMVKFPRCINRHTMMAFIEKYRNKHTCIIDFASFYPFFDGNPLLTKLELISLMRM